MLDPFDLEEWPLPALGPCRIYGDDRALIWALVDPEDYQWALQWRWSPIRRPGRGVYLRRATGGSRYKIGGGNNSGPLMPPGGAGTRSVATIWGH